MAKSYGPKTMPDDHAALIGRIAEAWAHFEFFVDQAIWTAVGAEHQLVACVTSQLQSIHPRLKAFTAIITLLGASKPTIDKMSTFSGSVSGLIEKRNRSVHDPRFKQKNKNEMFRLEITAKPKVHFGFVSETTDDLQDIVDKITQKIEEFALLRDAVIKEVQNIPQESRPPLLRIIPLNPDL